MATKKKAGGSGSRAKKKPAVSLEVVVDGDYWIYRALDEDGKEVSRGAEGSRNRHYTEKVALEAHPDLPVTLVR